MAARRAALLALALVGIAVTAAPAGAAPGELEYLGCASNSGAPNCAPVPVNALTWPRSVVVSPDGASVLVATASGVLVDLRVADGQLSFGRCLANPPFPDCDPVPGNTLLGARAVAISPEGRSVYVSANSHGAVSHFFREPSGALSFGGCLASKLTAIGCSPLDKGVINVAEGIAVSPDGSALYVAGATLTSLDRTVGGQVQFRECVANKGSDGCQTILNASPIDGANEVAVSPDSREIYVASDFSNTLSHFHRAAIGGALLYRGCLGDGPPAATGCTDLPGEPLAEVKAVAVSPDGKSVFTVAKGANSLSHFRRDSAGTLQFVGCLASDDAPGCVDLPRTPLDEAAEVAISPEGDKLYVVANTGSLAEFRLTPGAELEYVGCLAEVPILNDCRPVPPGVLGAPTSVAAGPDGKVYVTSQFPPAVAAFGTEPPPPNQPRQDPPPQQDPPPVRCQGKVATIVGSAAGEVLRGTPGRDVIAGLGGGDVIHGRGGADLICGGAGADRLFGGAGADRLDGGPGADRLNGGAGADRLLGGPGRDRCEGGPGRDVVRCELGSGR